MLHSLIFDPARSGDLPVALGSWPASPPPPVRNPRQLDHDIQHELATIALLASLLGTADDVGPDSRRRAEQIVEETQWLNRLVRAASSRPRLVRADGPGRFDASALTYPSVAADPSGRTEPPVRIDRVATEVVAAARLSTVCTVRLDAGEIWAPVDPLSFWRVLTNLVGNAVRAAGPDGEVTVRIYAANARVVVQVEDDGPGFGAGPAGSGAHGLDIARDMVLSMNGELQIGNGARGGCRVRLCLPTPPPEHLRERAA